ncbi:MAG: DUF86 domain-containing protein [Nanoarchaeota archaeon]
MTKHEDLPYLNHILESISDIEESVKGFTKDQFIKNKDVKEANIRRIELIGEAAKNISNTIKRKYNQIQWTKIIGTRDKVIHHYFGVNLDIIWEIIKKDLPDLKDKILKIKEELSKR